MRILVIILGVFALSKAQVEVQLPFGNPAGVTLTGAGFANNFAFQPHPEGQPQQQQAQPQPQQLQGPQPLSAGEPQPIPQEQPQGPPEPSGQYQQPQYAYSANPGPQPQFGSPAPLPQPQFANPAPLPQPQYAGPAPGEQLQYASPAPVEQQLQYASPAPVEQQLQYASPAPVEQQLQYASPAPVEQPQPVGQVLEQPQYASPAPVQQYAYAGQPAQVQQFNTYAAAPAPLQYHRAIEYGPAPVAPVAAVAPLAAVAPIVQKHHQQFAYPHYAAPQFAAFQQQLGYAATPVLTKVPGVADVPVTKLAYSQGFTQQEVDVHQPAVSTRKVKVRRPALRKEFYDIEHRVIVRPAGSATLELSQPISKEQQGPAVLTATKFAHIAPVVRYGAGRRIVDGESQNFGGAFGARSAPAPAPEAPQQPEVPRPQANLRNAPAQPQRLLPQAFQRQRAQFRQAVDEDTEVVEAAGQPQGRDLPNEPQPIPQEQPQQQQPQPGPDAGQPQPPQQQPQPGPYPGQPQPPQQPPQAPGQENGRGIPITPDMPLALQNRLLELLTAKGGTVTEILNKDGSPADSASVLQVADALGDPQLQGGERITTRRIVVTRPIETVQEIEVQEPATKIHRKIVQQPALFKHHVPAVARVPVAVPAVKHVATPVVKTTYTAAHPAAYSFNYQAPQFSYSH